MSELALLPALRFLHFAALLGLFGLTAFPLVGGRSARTLPGSTGPVLPALAVSAPLLTVALMVVSIAAMMGQSPADLAWAPTWEILTSTDLGLAFFVRALLLAIIAVALAGFPRVEMARAVACAAAAMALLTLGWTGHAAMEDGLPGLLHRLNNWVHLLAAGLWIGAISGFLGHAVETLRAPDRAIGPTLLQAMQSFASTGAILVVLVVASGLLNSQFIFGLDHLREVSETGYGRFLLAKVVVLLLMLMVAVHNAVSVRGPAHDAGVDQQPAPALLARLRTSLAGELGLALLIIALVSILGTMSPTLEPTP